VEDNCEAVEDGLSEANCWSISVSRVPVFSIRLFP
jgi:hypothetical protein